MKICVIEELFDLGGVGWKLVMEWLVEVINEIWVLE